MPFSRGTAPVLLKQGISLKELTEGTDIEVEPNDNVDTSSDSEAEFGFDDKVFDSFKEELQRLAMGESKKVDLESMSISELKEFMSPLTEDRLVLKAEIKSGTGSIIPEKSIVFIHYNAFIEDQKTPFDSTYLRGKPFRFLLGSSGLVLGLEIGIKTMKKGEISKFLVHSDYAYGPMGCPPRIPPEATVLYQVEIINFIQSAEAIEFEEMTPEEQRKAPFPKVLAVCKLEHQLGNDMVQKKKYGAAAARYQRAIKLLEDVSVKDFEEDKKRQSFLLKLYLNIALSYLNLNRPKRVISYAKKALNIDVQNTKALYRLGVAYMHIGEFEDAKHYLIKAKHNSPYDSDIVAALQKLERRHEQYSSWEKSFCKNMLKN